MCGLFCLIEIILVWLGEYRLHTSDIIFSGLAGSTFCVLLCHSKSKCTKVCNTVLSMLSLWKQSVQHKGFKWSITQKTCNRAVMLSLRGQVCNRTINVVIQKANIQHRATNAITQKASVQHRTINVVIQKENVQHKATNAITQKASIQQNHQRCHSESKCAT